MKLSVNRWFFEKNLPGGMALWVKVNKKNPYLSVANMRRQWAVT